MLSFVISMSLTGITTPHETRRNARSFVWGTRGRQFESGRSDHSRTIIGTRSRAREAVVVDFTATRRDKLLPGETVFLLAVDGEDRSVTSPAIVVGQNGVEPPM